MFTRTKWMLLFVLVFAGCTTSGASKDGAKNTRNGDVAVEDGANASDAEGTSLSACRPDQAISLGQSLQGFEAATTSWCGDPSRSASGNATVVSVADSELVVEAEENGRLSFQGWSGPSLEGVFSNGDSVTFVLPCSAPWSIIQGANVSIASLSVSPTQYWNQSVELSSPETLSEVPYLRLEPTCRAGERYYNSLTAIGLDGESVRWVRPGRKGVDDWSIFFGGSEWCCQSSTTEVGEPPETTSIVNLYQDF
jgi:hypothetical protein